MSAPWAGANHPYVPCGAYASSSCFNRFVTEIELRNLIMAVVADNSPQHAGELSNADMIKLLDFVAKHRRLFERVFTREQS